MTSNIYLKKIAIHSVPRSGSSWIGQIFNSSPDVNFKFQPLFSYEFKDYLNEVSNQQEVDRFFQCISESQDDFLLQKDKVNAGIYPDFMKNVNYTHIVYKEVRYHHILENMMQVHPNIIVIGIIRNPYAVINSFLNAPREFRKDFGWDELIEWQYAKSKNQERKEEFFGFEKWKEVASLFHKLKEQYPNRFYLINYSNFLKNTEQEVTSVFKFCDIKLSPQTLNFILESTQINKEDVYSVFKTRIKDDAWKKTLNSFIVDVITKDLKRSSLKKYINS